MQRIAIFVLAGGLLLPGRGWGGAWVREPGTAYLKLSTETLSTQERFDQNGDKVQWDTSGGGFRNAKYEELALALYGEYGLSARWTGVGKVTWKYLTAAQPSADFATWGLADIEIGLVGAITRGKFVSSFGTQLIVPTGYDPAEYPALGSGVTDLEVAVFGGLAPNPFWFEGKVGYRIRGGAFSDQAVVYLKGGWNMSRRLGARAELWGARSIDEDASAGSGSQPPGRFDPATVSDPRHVDVAGAVQFEFVTGVALELEARSAVEGSNTLSGTRWILSLTTHPAWRVFR